MRGTSNHDPKERPRSTQLGSYRGSVFIALLAALALLASACGSDDRAMSAESATETTSDAAEDAAEAVSDSVVTSDDTDDAMFDDEEEAMEEEAMEEESREEVEIGRAPAAADGDAESEYASALEESAGETADGGLFGQDSEEQFAPAEPERERLFDNRFADYGYREFIDADDDPFSTFALDVDTGSYTVARRWLDEGILPPPESVRVEEFVNAFDYDYESPRRGLEVSVDGGPSPFDADNYLVRVGVQAEDIAAGERPPVALTFIVDTSGSMDRDDRLGLVKDSLEILVDELEDDDSVAIVVYSDNSGVVLEPTPVRDSRRIYDAIDSLRSGGSTNLESGLREGYELARSAFREDGINRVIIASDGVANAGITSVDSLSGYIRGFADDGIQLVTVGYGMGNFNDEMMEQLADNGDGFYAYVDSEDEAERLFEDELTSTLVTVAIDAKIQVEFDPDVVREYRLVGFENRGVRDSDFRNDAVDAGELGAGHQVTAMYEVELHRGVSIDDRGDIGEVFLRWEDPNSGEVIEIDEDIDLRDVAHTFGDTATDYQLATVVTAFAEVLRDNPYADDVDLTNVLVEAERVADRVDTDEADELIELLQQAVGLS